VRELRFQRNSARIWVWDKTLPQPTKITVGKEKNAFVYASAKLQSIHANVFWNKRGKQSVLALLGREMPDLL